jgi:hypothetical protein
MCLCMHQKGLYIWVSKCKKGRYHARLRSVRFFKWLNKWMDSGKAEKWLWHKLRANIRVRCWKVEGREFNWFHPKFNKSLHLLQCQMDVRVSVSWIWETLVQTYNMDIDPRLSGNVVSLFLERYNRRRCVSIVIWTGSFLQPENRIKKQRQRFQFNTQFQLLFEICSVCTGCGQEIET